SVLRQRPLAADRCAPWTACASARCCQYVVKLWPPDRESLAVTDGASAVRTWDHNRGKRQGVGAETRPFSKADPPLGPQASSGYFDGREETFGLKWGLWRKGHLRRD